MSDQSYEDAWAEGEDTKPVSDAVQAAQGAKTAEEQEYADSWGLLPDSNHQAPAEGKADGAADEAKAAPAEKPAEPASDEVADATSAAPAAEQAAPAAAPTFKEAFAKARANGMQQFEWNGKRYTTELKAAPAAKPAAKPAAPAAKAGENYGNEGNRSVPAKPAAKPRANIYSDSAINPAAYMREQRAPEMNARPLGPSIEQIRARNAGTK